MLERNSRQDELTDWLDDNNIENPDDLTDFLVDFGFTVGWPGELNQVWTNLIDNAVDAIPDGGDRNQSRVIPFRVKSLFFAWR